MFGGDFAMERRAECLQEVCLCVSGFLETSSNLRSLMPAGVLWALGDAAGIVQ
jgi:hypothetical protein